ncbi:MAG: PspC domain-containing protein [Dehalococcoidales bacterium]|nr:PspC domain-containing protein [Dehalococcoidales bacterium]
MERRLYRSRKNRLLFGVCGGLGEYLKIDPVLFRIVAILLLIPGVFPAIIAYLVLTLVIPLEGSQAVTPRDTLRENMSDVRDTANSLGEDVRTSFERKESAGPPDDASQKVASDNNYKTDSNRSLYILGIIIIALGIFLLLMNIFDWFWRYFWPVLLIFAGAVVIYLVTRKKK